MKFLVMEIQVFPDGGVSTPVTSFDDRNKAEAKYHSVLSSAAVSKLATHAAVLLTEEGALLESKFYHHEEA